MFFVEVMCLDSIVSVSYNIFVFWFMGNDGIMYDGFDDDGEYGVGRLLLKVFIDNDVKNILVVVLWWYGNKIGFRCFKYINEVGLSVVRNMLGFIWILVNWDG